METLIAAVVGLCILVIVGARFARPLRMLACVASTVLVAFVALIVWWGLLYFQIVSIDSAFLQSSRSSAWLGTLVFFGPPVAVAVVLAVLQARRLRRVHETVGRQR